MNHTVIIASSGRPDVLADTVESVLRQSTPPDEIILSVPGNDAVLPRTAALPRLRIVHGPRGLTSQRNTGLRAVANNAEIITFFDDDVELAPDYLTRAQEMFAARADVVLFCGRVLDDGVKKGGISRDEARRVITAQTPESGRFTEEGHAYGCNMNVRRHIADRVGFDERLPLYGWLEDLDFAARCSRHGNIGRFTGCAFVHLGVPSGRVSGGRYGYSQVMNPVYLWRKGSINAMQTLHYVARALIRNGSGAVAADRLVDRPGRFHGNLLALLHLAGKRIDPGHILHIG
jgi:GT2 family glycosyltransferase